MDEFAYVVEPKRHIYTHSERECLRRLVMQYRHVVEDKNTNSATIEEKRKAWGEITEHYNANPSNSKRSVSQLKKLWDNLKTKRKALLMAAKRERLKREGREELESTEQSGVDLELSQALDAVADHYRLIQVPSEDQGEEVVVDISEELEGGEEGLSAGDDPDGWRRKHEHEREDSTGERVGSPHLQDHIYSRHPDWEQDTIHAPPRLVWGRDFNDSGTSGTTPAAPRTLTRRGLDASEPVIRRVPSAAQRFRRRIGDRDRRVMEMRLRCNRNETLIMNEEVLHASRMREAWSKEKAAASEEFVAASKEKVSASKEKIAASKEKHVALKEKVLALKEKVGLSKENVAVSKERVAASKEITAASKEKVAGSKEKIAESKEKVAASKERVAASREKVAALKEKAAELRVEEAQLRVEETKRRIALMEEEARLKREYYSNKGS